MFIIFGLKGRKHTKGDGNILKNSCPSCNEGDLTNKLYRRWFTLFFIPVIPLDVIDNYYECNSCGQAFKENIKSVLQKSEKEQNDAIEQSKLLYAKATIGAMTHMALIDGDFNVNEERVINNFVEDHKIYKTELQEIINTIKQDVDNDDFVFELLNKSRNILSAESLLNILSSAAVILLADGKIVKKEEKLFKEYLLACGLPKSMYFEIITKTKNKDHSRYLNS